MTTTTTLYRFSIIINNIEKEVLYLDIESRDNKINRILNELSKINKDYANLEWLKEKGLSIFETDVNNYRGLNVSKSDIESNFSYIEGYFIGCAQGMEICKFN
jgi:hypothetical protein